MTLEVGFWVGLACVLTEWVRLVRRAICLEALEAWEEDLQNQGRVLMVERMRWFVAASAVHSGRCPRCPGIEKRLIRQGTRVVSGGAKVGEVRLGYDGAWSRRGNNLSPADNALSPLPFRESAPLAWQCCQKSRAPFLFDVGENGGRRSRYACVSRQRLSTRLARQQVPERVPVESRVSSSDTDFALSYLKLACQMLWRHCL